LISQRPALLPGAFLMQASKTAKEQSPKTVTNNGFERFLFLFCPSKG